MPARGSLSGPPVVIPTTAAAWLWLADEKVVLTSRRALFGLGPSAISSKPRAEAKVGAAIALNAGCPSAVAAADFVALRPTAAGCAGDIVVLAALAALAAGCR